METMKLQFRPEPEASVDLRSHFLRDFRVHVDFSLDKNLSAWKSKICLRGLAQTGYVDRCIEHFGEFFAQFRGIK